MHSYPDLLRDLINRLYRYVDYQERRAQADIKYRAKKARKEHDDGEWGGITSDKEDGESDDDEVVMDSSDESEDEGAETGAESKKLITSLEDEGKKINGLSKKAALFFDQDIFKDIGADLEEEEEEDEVEAEEAQEGNAEDDGVEEGPETDSDWEADVGNLEIQDQPDDENGGFEVVPIEKGESNWGDDDDSKQSSFPQKKPYKFEFYTDIPPRHRYHHRRSHDPRTTTRHGRNPQIPTH